MDTRIVDFRLVFAINIEIKYVTTYSFELSKFYIKINNNIMSIVKTIFSFFSIKYKLLILVSINLHIANG